MASSKTDLVVGLVMLDKFSKTFDKFNRDMETGAKQSGAFSGALGKVGAALSIGAVAAFGTSAVKAYGDALQSQQMLMDAFSKQPQLIGYSVQALMEYNRELSTKIAYDDDEINKAQANLALFKLTGDQIRSITPLVADLARRKNVDLATAATSVGKAMQGQARGLKDLGIQFTATGDTAKDYAVLTAALNQQVGGTAEAFAQGNPLGQMQNMQIAFGNMQETIGKALVPAMTAFTNVMTPIANLLGSIPAPVLQIGLAFGVMTVAVRAVVPAVTGFIAAQRAQAAAAEAARIAELRKAAATTGGIITMNAAAGSARGLAGAMTLAANAGRGLMTALGGPIGLAITAVTTAISFFAFKSDDATMATEGWTQSLERQNGVLTDNAKLQIAQKLANEGNLQAAEASGIAVTDYTAALLEGGEARQRMADQLLAIAEAHAEAARKSQADASQNLDLVYAEQAAEDSARKAADALLTLGGELDASAAASSALSAVTTGLGIAQDDAADAAGNQASALLSLKSVTSQISDAFGGLAQDALRSSIASAQAAKSLLQIAYATGKITDQSYVAQYQALAQEIANLNAQLETSIDLFGDTSDDDTVAGGADNAAQSTERLTNAQQRLVDRLQKSRGALADLVAERARFVTDTARSGMDFATVFGLSPADAKTASEAWASAQNDVAKAQAALASVAPGDLDARAKAQDDLNAAIAREGEAKAAANAAAFTPANVRTSYESKFAKLKSFADDIGKLTAAGVPQIILQDILNAGIDGGSDMAHMLATHPKLLQSLKATAAGIETQSVRVGALAANYLYGDAITGAQSAYQRDFNIAQTGGAIGANAQPIEVTLKLDSAVVYKQLLRLRRERGGASLGV